LDDRQVLDIVLGENGILETYRRRADRERRPLIVVHSTVMPATMVTLSEAAATVGVGVLDAPVSGGREGSVAGTLTLMVSGDTADQERCRPLFDAVGRNIFSVGDAPGMGSVAKLCNNVLALTSTLALVEAMELAGAYGIAEQTIVDIANVSTGMSWFTQHWGFTDGLMEGHTLAASGEVKYLLTKDLWDAVVAGRDKRVDLVLSAVGAQAGPTLLEARRLKRADAHSIPPAQ
jgi:3-hydroxyisobutyrate dehydrogenase-like beta-hydroxyacid dehydrogenase